MPRLTFLVPYDPNIDGFFSSPRTAFDLETRIYYHKLVASQTTFRYNSSLWTTSDSYNENQGKDLSRSVMSKHCESNRFSSAVTIFFFNWAVSRLCSSFLLILQTTSYYILLANEKFRTSCQEIMSPKHYTVYQTSHIA